MSVFMTSRHASEINKTLKTKEDMTAYWKSVFGETVEVIFGDLRGDTFDAEIGV